MLGGINRIEILGFENIKADYADEWRSIVTVFRDAKQAYGDKFSDRFLVTLIHSDGTREELK